MATKTIDDINVQAKRFSCGWTSTCRSRTEGSKRQEDCRRAAKHQEAAAFRVQVGVMSHCGRPSGKGTRRNSPTGRPPRG